MNEIHLYITEDGQELRIPPEIVKATAFTKAGLPDKRKSNAEFHAWLATAITEPHINGDESRQPEDVLPAKAQAYALRVWSGQSPDVPRNERLRRVKLALEGQGLSMEGVVL